jgi:aryl carrier-like protein
MKTLREQIDEILKQDVSMNKKRDALISLGLKSTDIVTFLRFTT